MSTGGATFLPLEASWAGFMSWLFTTIGVSSTFGSSLSNPFVWDSLKLLILGSVIETGRRIVQWLIRRFRTSFSISAEFNARDPAYEWLVFYLTKENVWRTSRDFRVEAKTSQRKWSVKDTGVIASDVNYIPAYRSLHFFHWRGYWLELTSSSHHEHFYDDGVEDGGRAATLFLTIYTLDMTALFAFVEDCRTRFLEGNKSWIAIHTSNSDGVYPGLGRGGRPWTNVKMKRRRPIESLILDGAVIESLLADTRDFLAMENWYIKAGIPHRRGYLLYGPPGTGKTTTVYAMAGELGLGIYSLSLASPGINDSTLAREVSQLPPRGILLIEDIDCAFSSREDNDSDQITEYRSGGPQSAYSLFGRQDSPVTLSGLLNILDGIGSEEGKIFFATTNHIDRLDPALLRPGRIDRKIEYKLASQRQARALFKRFFPSSEFTKQPESSVGPDAASESSQDMDSLADQFASGVPEYEFSTAELQGYLLDWKVQPLSAARGIREWVQQEQEFKRAQETREKARKERIEAARARERSQGKEVTAAGIFTAPDDAHGVSCCPCCPPPTSGHENDIKTGENGTMSNVVSTPSRIGRIGVSRIRGKASQTVNGDISTVSSPESRPVFEAKS